MSLKNLIKPKYDFPVQDPTGHVNVSKGKERQRKAMNFKIYQGLKELFSTIQGLVNAQFFL